MNMRSSIKYFLFILDELFILFLILLILYFFNVSLIIMIGALFVFGVFLIFVSYVFLPQLNKPVTGTEGLIGIKGVALESFDNKGMVLVHGERWKAVTSEGALEKGDEIIVSEVNGLTLVVKKNN